jgi:galactokinase
MLAAAAVLGARQAGAGFGGCMVAVVDPPSLEAFSAAVRRHYLASTRTWAEIYPVQAAAGAGRMD